MSDAFYTDSWRKSDRRIRVWYQENLTNVLQAAKERQARDIDASIALAEELIAIYDEPAAKAIPVPPHDIVRRDDDSLMKPIEPEVLNILYGCTENGATEKYLKTRCKKAPEDNIGPILIRFYFRQTSNWDYGWQQKQSHVKARDMNRGRCAILRDTFYRKNNLAPDPRHYSTPAGGEFSICSEYSCSAN